MLAPSWPLHIVIAILVTVTPLRGQICAAQRVSRDDLVQAMRLHGDYDILATMNRGRFTTELLLRLAREAQQRDPDGAPLYVEPDDWFAAYLETAGITRDEAPRSPPGRSSRSDECSRPAGQRPAQLRVFPSGAVP